MSLRRSVVLSVVLEGRTQAQTARAYGVSKATVSRWVTRYRAEGDTAFEARSRRPRTTPAAIPAETVELVVNLRSELSAQGLGAGPHTIAWHLQRRHGIAVSPSTIRRRLAERGLVEPNPKKRPRSSYVRFQADLSNEMWQSDFCHWALCDGSTTEIITWLDDHSRYALSVTAHRRITGPIVVDTFDQTCADHGFPASTLTDNAMVYTTRLSGGRGGRNALETLLADLGIEQKNSAPNHPHHLRKSREIPTNPQKMAQSPTPRHHHRPTPNTHRPIHPPLQPQPPPPQLDRKTPAAAYNRLPKATPDNNGTDTHFRVRHDRVDKSGTVTLRHNGKLHHIGIGRAHKHTPVTLLVADLHIRIVDHTTGELLRRLTLDPTRDYQPQPKT